MRDSLQNVMFCQVQIWLINIEWKWPRRVCLRSSAGKQLNWTDRYNGVPYNYLQWRIQGGVRVEGIKEADGGNTFALIMKSEFLDFSLITCIIWFNFIFISILFHCM